MAESGPTKWTGDSHGRTLCRKGLEIAAVHSKLVYTACWCLLIATYMTNVLCENSCITLHICWVNWVVCGWKWRFERQDLTKTVFFRLHTTSDGVVVSFYGPVNWVKLLQVVWNEHSTIESQMWLEQHLFAMYLLKRETVAHLLVFGGSNVTFRNRSRVFCSIRCIMVSKNRKCVKTAFE